MSKSNAIAHRFPSDFLFTVSHEEFKVLRSQIATSNSARGGRRYLPHAFTEHGAIMAATVLNSKRAIEMSLFVVRAFVNMRDALVVNQHVASKLAEIEARLNDHDDRHPAAHRSDSRTDGSSSREQPPHRIRNSADHSETSNGTLKNIACFCSRAALDLSSKLAGEFGDDGLFRCSIQL